MTQTQTAKLQLPYIASSQAQKHITHNEALRMLDALVHMSVKARDIKAAPQDPKEGERYLIGQAATGLWAGHDNQIAAWQDGAWAYFLPANGWRIWVETEKRLYAWQEDSWEPVGQSDMQGPLSTLGVNASADETNRFAVRSPASLFSHEGSGHQIKLNKNAGSDTASFLYQTNWSGRAEMGLAGSDDFSLKVSANGVDWLTALAIARSDAVATFKTGVNSGTMVLADDSVGTIDVPRAAGIFFLWNANDPYPEYAEGRYAIITFDTGATPRCSNIISDGKVGVLFGTTPEGQTGNDNDISIFVQERKIHVENRRNRALVYRWFILA